MSNPQSNQWLQWICTSENPNELREKYDQWAVTYETDIADAWNSVPPNAAHLLAKYMGDKQKNILDVGVGTGLVGVELAALGFDSLSGFDISPGMLAQADEKKVYRSLQCCSIGDPCFMNLEKAAGIVATGVFAENHAGPSELGMLKTKIEPEGILVFTARQSFLPKLQDVLSQTGWSLLEQKMMPIYDDPMYLLAYRISH